MNSFLYDDIEQFEYDDPPQKKLTNFQTFDIVLLQFNQPIKEMI